jgi:outer membrane receptor protein involved in Fe transport
VCSSDLKLLLGTDFLLSHVNLTGQAPAPVREGEQPLPVSAETSQALSEKRVDFSIGLYAELVARITRSLTVTPGLRFDWFGSIQRIGFDPRLGVRYQLTPITAVKAGIGQYTQDPQPTDVSRSIGNPHLRPERAIHYALSVEQGIWPGLMFEATGFYKSLSDLVVTSNQRLLVDGVSKAEHTANLGDGRIYGGEFLLRQSLSKYFFGWISYTLLRSERRDCDGCAWRLFDYDQTHVLVVVAHAYLPRGWELGARFRYISGNPVTRVQGATYDADADVYVPGKFPVNADRLDAFHQLDIRVDKTFTFKRWLLKIYLDVSNVYNHLSPEQLQYSYDYKRSAAFTGLPIIPAFGVRGEL